MEQHITRHVRAVVCWRAMAESVARDVGPSQAARRVAEARPYKGTTPGGMRLVAHLGLDEGLYLVNHQGILGLQRDLPGAKPHPAAHEIM